MLSLALVVLGVVTLFGVLFAPALARVLTAGVSDPAIAADQRELATFLLRFFVPQVLLYALGTVGTAVLQSRGRFVLTAIAPIGNTIVLVASMVVFRADGRAEPRPPPVQRRAAGRSPSAARVGVIAFVGVTAVAVWASGFRYRFGVRRAVRDARRAPAASALRVGRAPAAPGSAILLGAALVAARWARRWRRGLPARDGRVPRARTGSWRSRSTRPCCPASPPRSRRGTWPACGATLRWAVDAMAAVTAPVAALLVGAVHARDGGPRVRRGEPWATVPPLLAAALGGLAIGIPAYGGFLLLTRASYALGDSRTPALAALGQRGRSARSGCSSPAPRSTVPACLWGIAGAHTAAQVIGTLWLARQLHPHRGQPGAPPRLLRVDGRRGHPRGVRLARPATASTRTDGSSNLAFVTAVSWSGLAVYVAGLRLLRALPARGRRRPTVPPVALP